jgi:hypothetical protein
MKQKHFNYKHGKYVKGYQNHCIDCGCNIAIKSIRCNACNGKFRTGKYHHNYKTGKYTEGLKNSYFCKDCGKKISRPDAKRCGSCSVIKRYKDPKERQKTASKGIKNGNYNPEKHKQHYCKQCGKKISYKAYKNTGLCMTCSHKGIRNHQCQKPDIEINENLLIDFYINKKMTLYDLSKKFKFSRYLITKKLKKLNVKIRTLSESTKLRVQGKNNPAWKGGISKLDNLIKNSPEYKEWRFIIFKRDNFKCQCCGQVRGKIEVHHIKSFNKILKRFLKIYSTLSLTKNKYKLLELAKSYKPFWKLNNGITLCKKCHNKQHSNKEK